LIIEEAGGIMKYVNGENIKFRLIDKITQENFAVMAGSEEIITELQKSVLRRN
jgi:fructose-1,6-bisphosphatase/inositol monophosphatase family enzyme